MKLQARSLLAIVLLAGCAGGATPQPSSPAAAPNIALDGRSFEVTLDIPDATAVTDTLRFVGGKFESTACTALGFPEWSDYEARPAGDAVAFHVLATHPSGTTMDWNGNVRGDAVDGTANRTVNGKTDVLRFKSSRRD
jgi:hypothetical protein